MSDKRPHLSKFDPATLAQLACPACYGEMCLESSHVLCMACFRSYPIVDGIPVLIVKRTEGQAQDR